MIKFSRLFLYLCLSNTPVMQKSKDIFFYGGLNTDDDPRFIPDGDYREAYQARGGNAADGDEGSIVSMAGQQLIDNELLPAGENTVIGSAVWVEDNSIIFFVHNSNSDHSIFKYNITANDFTLVLTDAILNFSLFNKIYDARVANGILYWTDGYFLNYQVNTDGIWQYNPPRMLNIENAIAGYASVTEQTLDVIKWPVPNISDISYDTDTDLYGNKLYGNVYQFTAQWVYENGEESVWSPFTILPVPQQQEFISGRNYITPFEENVLTLGVPTGSELVKKIRVAVRSGNGGEFGVFTELDKEILGIANNIEYNVSYNGISFLRPLGLSETLRNYDRVPQVAKTLEILPTRQLTFGQYVEGYDPIEIDIEGSRVLHEVRNTVVPLCTFTYRSQNLIADSPIIIYNPTVTTVFPFQVGDYIGLSIPMINKTYYYQVTEADIAFSLSNTVTDSILHVLNNFGDGVVDGLIADGYTVTATPATGFLISNGYSIDITSETVYTLTTRVTTLNIPTYPNRSLKKGVTHEFGIQYYDRGLRSGGVQTIDTMNINVPFPFLEDLIPDYLADTHSPYFVTPRFEIAHTPPTWALYYQIVARKTNEIANFQQRIGLELTTDPNNPNLYKISLDAYYKSAYGANINQTPQKGDIARFVTTSASFVQTLPAYAQGYVEVEVQKYSATEGAGGAECIWVTKFDYLSIVDETGGFIFEIYTPAKTAETQPWFEIGAVKNIVNPYTADRTHEGDAYSEIVVVTSPSIGGDTFVLEGDQSVLGVVAGYSITFTPSVGADFTTTVASAVYDPSTNTTTVVVDDASSGATYLTCSFNTGQTDTLPATIDLDFGDVYLRPRVSNRFTNNTSVASLMRMYIEDFSVSDYYLSNSSNYGRIAIEDANFKRRELVSVIHGGAYIDNSLNNNICSFDFNPLNKVDLNEEYGKLTKIIMNGYTLKCLQERKETSIYIQRTMAVGADGGENVSYTDRTFGGVNPYESLYGTVHSGSVKVIDGQLFYFDYNNGVFIRSITNGQQDICNGKYKFNKYTTDMANVMAEWGGSSAWEVIAAVNENNSEYQFFARGVVNEQEVIYGTVFNFDSDRWKTYLQFAPTWAENLGVESVMWSNADMYMCDDGEYGSFLGGIYDFRVRFPFNDAPQYVKRPMAIGLRVNKVPDSVTAYVVEGNNYPAMRSTMTVFKTYENGVWTQYLRDELNVNVDIPYLKTEALARQNGRGLRGYYVDNEVFFEEVIEKIVLNSARVNWVFSEAVQ